MLTYANVFTTSPTQITIYVDSKTVASSKDYARD